MSAPAPLARGGLDLAPDGGRPSPMGSQPRARPRSTDTPAHGLTSSRRRRSDSQPSSALRENSRWSSPSKEKRKAAIRQRDGPRNQACTEADRAATSRLIQRRHRSRSTSLFGPPGRNRGVPSLSGTPRPGNCYCCSLTPEASLSIHLFIWPPRYEPRCPPVVRYTPAW